MTHIPEMREVTILLRQIADSLHTATLIAFQRLEYPIYTSDPGHAAYLDIRDRLWPPQPDED